MRIYDRREHLFKQVWQGDDTDPQTGTLVSETVYHYDLRGRMSKVEIDADGDGQIDTVTEYRYNPNGIRVKQTVIENPGTAEEEVTVHEYVIASRNHTGYAQVLEEWIDGQLVNTFTIGHTILAQHDATNGTLTFLVDGHNSTMALVNAALELVERYAYDAYGVQLTGAGLTAAADALVNHLYAGEQFDAKTGMQYLRARYYDPATGTFNRLDPWAGNIQDPQSLHKYLYAHANPVMNVDPTGLMSVTEVAVVTTEGMVRQVRDAASRTAPAAQTAMTTISGINHTLHLQRLIVLSATGAVALGAGAYGTAVLTDMVSTLVSYRNVIDAAEAEGTHTRQKLEDLPVFFIPRKRYPDIHEFRVDSLETTPVWHVLTRHGITALTTSFRAAAQAGFTGTLDSYNNSIDEFPYASTWQGGVLADTRAIPSDQNSLEGSDLGRFYKERLIGQPHPQHFLVVPVPFNA